MERPLTCLKIPSASPTKRWVPVFYAIETLFERAALIIVPATSDPVRNTVSLWWAVPTLKKPQFRRGAKHVGTASPNVGLGENETHPAAMTIKAEESKARCDKQGLQGTIGAAKPTGPSRPF